MELIGEECKQLKKLRTLFKIHAITLQMMRKIPPEKVYTSDSLWFYNEWDAVP